MPDVQQNVTKIAARWYTWKTTIEIWMYTLVCAMYSMVYYVHKQRHYMTERQERHIR